MSLNSKISELLSSILEIGVTIFRITGRRGFGEFSDVLSFVIDRIRLHHDFFFLLDLSFLLGVFLFESCKDVNTAFERVFIHAFISPFDYGCEPLELLKLNLGVHDFDNKRSIFFSEDC